MGKPAALLQCTKSASHIEYLKAGEEKVNRFEELISFTADRIYMELLSPPETGTGMMNILGEDTAVVVFGGLSLMEMLTPWVVLEVIG